MFKQADIELLKTKIHQADAIIIGGGSGLSSAAGYNHYHWRQGLTDSLRLFIDYYGFKSAFDGFYHCYSNYESQWGYYSNYIRAMFDAPTGSPYKDLKKLLGNKPHFVLTTNIDMQFERVFDPKDIFTYQGDMGYLQCSQPCHDTLYPAKDYIYDLSKQLDQELKVPTDLVPRCPECGRILIPWVRDDTFLEGKDYMESQKRYYNFANEWISQKDKNVLLLELGVGEMTPTIIKLPFWDTTVRNDNVTYICINTEDSSAPEHLGEKGYYIRGDLAEILHEAVKSSEV